MLHRNQQITLTNEMLAIQGPTLISCRKNSDKHREIQEGKHNVCSHTKHAKYAKYKVNHGPVITDLDYVTYVHSR